VPAGLGSAATGLVGAVVVGVGPAGGAGVVGGATGGGVEVAGGGGGGVALAASDADGSGGRCVIQYAPPPTTAISNTATPA
jgi:hypothetical protein